MSETKQPQTKRKTSLLPDSASDIDGLERTLKATLSQAETAYQRGLEKTEEQHMLAELLPLQSMTKNLKRFCTDPKVTDDPVGYARLTLHPGMEMTYRRMVWAAEEESPNYPLLPWKYNNGLFSDWHFKKDHGEDRELTLGWLNFYHQQLGAFLQYVESGRYSDRLATTDFFQFSWSKDEKVVIDSAQFA